MNYKAGDKVSIKATVENVTDDCVRIYAEGYGERNFNLEYAPIEQKTYEMGLNDAWELAKKIMVSKEKGGYSATEVCEIFGMSGFQIFDRFTPEEALAKIEAYEKEKEIKVGDVVVQKDTQKKFLVVTEEDDNSVYEFGVIDLETLMLDRICNDTKIFQKTGKHIDIESLLRQIGE